MLPSMIKAAKFTYVILMTDFFLKGYYDISYRVKQ